MGVDDALFNGAMRSVLTIGRSPPKLMEKSRHQARAAGSGVGRWGDAETTELCCDGDRKSAWAVAACRPRSKLDLRDFETRLRGCGKFDARSRYVVFRGSGRRKRGVAGVVVLAFCRLSNSGEVWRFSVDVAMHTGRAGRDKERGVAKWRKAVRGPTVRNSRHWAGHNRWKPMEEQQRLG